MPSGTIRPSRMASVFSLRASAMLSSSLSVMVCSVPLSGPGVFQDSRHFDIAAATGKLKRRVALSVRNIDVGAGLDQRPHRGGVVRTAIAEHDGLQQRRET